MCFNASLVRPANVCHIGQQMSIMDLCFSTFHLYAWLFKSCRSTKFRHRVVFSTLGLYDCQFKPGRSTNCPSGTCLFQPSFLPDILECIHGAVYLFFFFFKFLFLTFVHTVLVLFGFQRGPAHSIECSSVFHNTTQPCGLTELSII